MPRSNWRIVFAAVGVAVLAGGSAILVECVDYAERYQPSADQYRRPTNDKLTDVKRAADALDAIAKGQTSAQEEDRSRRDLDAQEGAARWAKWAAWAAFVQLILSAVGICFVIRTLRQGQAGLGAARRALGHARAANDIARDTAQKQLRAYLDFDYPGFCKKPTHAEMCGASFGVAIPVKNFGQTPARDVEVTTRVSIKDGEGIVLDVVPSHNTFSAISPTDHGTARVFFGIQDSEWAELGTGQLTAVVKVDVSYTDVFGDPHELGTVFESAGHNDKFGFVSGTRRST